MHHIETRPKEQETGHKFPKKPLSEERNDQTDQPRTIVPDQKPTDKGDDSSKDNEQ